MKVLHVIDALGMGGGAEHSLAESLPRLRERGVESTVACLFPREGGLQEELRKAGFPVVLLAGHHLPGRVAALRRLVLDTRPDLIHATLFNACLVSRLAGIGLGIPEINSIVNTSYVGVRSRRLGVSRWKLHAVRLADRLTARHLVDRFHVLTRAVGRSVEEDLGIDASRITVIPRGRSLHRLGEPGPDRRRRTRERLGIAEEQPVLLNVAREDAQKGQVYLVRALPEILERFPRTIVLIAGRPGSASDEIEAALRSCGVDRAVRRLGHREDIADLLCAADLFVFPSLYEGLGCALLEAMALDVPVVASNVPAIREILGGHDPCGLLVPPGDEHALARGVLRALRDPAFSARLADNAKIRFLERYTLDRIIQHTLDLYETEVHQAPGQDVES